MRPCTQNADMTHRKHVKKGGCFERPRIHPIATQVAVGVLCDDEQSHLRVMAGAGVSFLGLGMLRRLNLNRCLMCKQLHMMN